MNKLMIIGAAVASLMGSPAVAADLALKAPRAPEVVSGWTGCYVGFNAGGAWGQSDITTASFIPPNANIPFVLAVAQAQSVSLRPSGFTGGGQIGCNWQPNTLLLGVETDFDYLGVNRSVSPTFVGPSGPVVPPQSITTTSSIATNGLFTVRARVGATWGNWLLYGTGGLAMTRIDFSTSYLNTVPGFVLESESANASVTKAGWTVGVGTEYAFAPNLTAKVEYLHADFGSIATSAQNVINPGTPGAFGFQVYSYNVPLRVDMVRAGINYRFWTGR